jgi:hypothetical protein
VKIVIIVHNYKYKAASRKNRRKLILTTSLSIRPFLSLNLVNLLACVGEMLCKSHRHENNHNYICKMENGASPTLEVLYMIKSKTAESDLTILSAG